MLQVYKQANANGESTGLSGGSSLADTLNSISGIVRRQSPIVVIILGCSIALGLLYLLTTPSSYTGKASMVIDTRKVQLFQQQSVLGDAPVDAGMVQTEIEILKSDNVSLSVIKDLHLTEDPEFVSPHSGLIGAAIGSIMRLVTGNTASDSQLEHRALETFKKRELISRVGLTYAMTISFESLDPNKAARIANALCDAYITDQLEAKYQATRRASLWLQDRIRELRTQSTTADKAVVDFKQANNITTVDPTGKSMNEQQMQEINSQLILAHAATAESKARLDRINEIMKQPIPDASVADALKSEVIIKLRSAYLDLAGRESLWAQRYGPNHLATVNLRNQMDELRRNISDEMQKIAESYHSDYDIAVAREKSLQQSLDQTVTTSNVSNQAQVQLRELESNAQSYRTMYDNFQQRYMEAIQQESFPITEARIISPANRPLVRSSPRTALVLIGALLGGMIASLAIAFLREFADRVYRSTNQVEESLQVPCLAMLPAIKLAGMEIGTAPEGPLPPRTMTGLSGMWRYAMDQPFSQFTEALRAVKVAVDLANVTKTNRVIGITSTLPNEGKSTTSMNFAQMIAHAGNRVLLVDSDLRNPSLSRALAPGAKTGLVDLLTDRVQLNDAIWTEPKSGLYFLPVGGDAKLLHTNEILASEKVRQLFSRLRDQFDYLIVDFAPLAPVVDTRTTTNFIDSYVYVVEWGRTKIEVVEHGLADAREIYERVLGVVLNKADLSVLGRYERYRSRYYYRKYYRRYGYTT